MTSLQIGNWRHARPNASERSTYENPDAITTSPTHGLAPLTPHQNCIPGCHPPPHRPDGCALQNHQTSGDPQQKEVEQSSLSACPSACVSAENLPQIWHGSGFPVADFQSMEAKFPRNAVPTLCAPRRNSRSRRSPPTLSTTCSTNVAPLTNRSTAAVPTQALKRLSDRGRALIS